MTDDMAAPRPEPDPLFIRQQTLDVLHRRHPLLQPRDVIILSGYGYAARFIYPQIRVAGEVVDMDRIVRADMFGVAKVALCVPEVSEPVALRPPYGWGMETLLFTCDRVSSWMQDLRRPEWAARAKEVERNMRMIDRCAGLIPNSKESARTMRGVIAGNLGEDYDPATRRARNGEFADGPFDREQGKIIAGYAKLLQEPAMGRPCFKWSCGDEGYEIERGEIASVLEDTLGKGKRRKDKTVSLDADDGPRELEESMGVAPGQDTLAALREVRELAADLPDLRDWLEAVLDNKGLADSEDPDAVVARAHDLVEHVVQEEDPAMQGALLHQLGVGSRRHLAGRFGVTPEAIRHRDQRAAATLRQLLAS